MILRRTHEIVPLETPGGNRTSVLAARSQGSREISILQQEQEPGGSNPLHYHDHEEIMLLLSGAATVQVGDQQETLSAGDVLIVPSQTVHQVQTSGEEPAKWMLVSSNLIRYFKPDGEEMIPKWTVPSANE